MRHRQPINDHSAMGCKIFARVYETAPGIVSVTISHIIFYRGDLP
jgi:hypothetical protein